MDGKVLARIGAIVFVSVAITATVIELARRDEPAPTQSQPSPGAASPRPDPLRETLLRCQELGEAATRDADCLAGWAENRRRFLGQPEGN
jgi:conjugative transfer region protein TrbK